MKKIFLLFLLLSGTLYVRAQIPASAQKQIEEAQQKLKELQSDPKVREAMQKAGHLMDSLKSDRGFQQQMARSRHMLDSAKKTNPALATIQIPDLNAIKMPDLDSLSANLSKASAVLQQVNKNLDQSMPKENPFKHADALPALTNKDLRNLAESVLENTKKRIDMIRQSALDKMIKDTSINAPGTGALILASGGSKDAAAFLICNGILKDPGNEWAVNDLGVYFRDYGQYEKSLQCYFYANSLDSGRSTVINTNIGWASAYYGDFTTALRYFDKALAIDNNYSKALEGEALIAFRQGNISKLFQCLAKEIHFAGGAAGNNGPSDDFANVCAGASADQAVDAAQQNTNPNNDHTFDNAHPDYGNSQDPPPGADVYPITYPNFRKAFVSDAKQLINAHIECQAQAAEAQKSINYLVSKAKQTGRTPLYKPAYMDPEGRLVYPKTFTKFVNLFCMVEMQFDRRLNWYNKALLKKINPYNKQVIARDGDMMMQYNKGVMECAKLSSPAEERCALQLMCKSLPKMYHSKQNDLDVIARAWDDYYNQIATTIQWFIDATAPFISRVHDEDWNTYLNTERELEVREAILGAYGDWDYCLESITSPIVFYIQQPAPACAPVEVAGITPPDPFSKKPKHIKEFEGPCYDMKFNTFGVGLSAEETCHATTFSLEAGPLKLFYTHVNDPIYAENNGYTNKAGVDISVSKDLDIVKVGKGKNEKAILSGSVGVEGKVSLDFDQNWQFTGGTSSVGASANIGGLNLGGIEASRTVEMVSGQLHVNPLSVTTTAPLQ